MTKCTNPATEGVLLTEDITLYAEWDRVLTGTLIVDGYFDSEHIVNDADRATHALIELEEITPDGTYNISGVQVEIEWTEGKHFSEPVPYKFTGLDPDKTYRIDVYLINYEAAYQNSTTVINGNGDIHDDYNNTDFTAVYSADSRWETFVNTYLHFEPESYFQPVEVDATRIGEGFRPTETLVEYLGKEAGADKDYGIIIQHEVEPFGVEVGIGADGKNDGTYGCEIWKKVFNGNLYDYQANLTKIDGDAVTDWPVIVVYGDSVRWSPYNQASTDSLKVTIIPMWYSVTYDWNMDDGYSETDSRGHVWSHESAIDYSEENTPVREGYVFKGWYADPECTGEKVTTIAADVHEDTTVYAKWEKRTDLELTVNHVIKDSVTVLDTETKASQTFGDIIAAEILKKDFTGYTYDSASAESVTIGTENNEITLYYTVNSYGYTVNYLEEGTDKALAAAKTGTAAYGETVTENAIVINGYSLVGDNNKSVTINTANNIITFCYATDFVGGENGTEGDGIPDKYQKKVVFEVINGTWSDGTKTDIVKYVTLTTAGKWDKNGSAVLVSPQGMIADEGFENGKWIVVPPSVVRGTNDEKFTYIFVEKTAEPEKPDSDIEIPGNVTVGMGESVNLGIVINPENGSDVPQYSSSNESVVKVDSDGNITGVIPGRATITVDFGDGNVKIIQVTVVRGSSDSGFGSLNNYICFGKTEGIGWYRVSRDGGKTYEVVFGNSLLEVENGEQIIISVGDLPIDTDSYVFYVNEKIIPADKNGNIVITVNGYMLIRAVGYTKYPLPDNNDNSSDEEPTLNWFQRIIKAIKEFFAKLFGL